MDNYSERITYNIVFKKKYKNYKKGDILFYNLSPNELDIYCGTISENYTGYKNMGVGIYQNPDPKCILRDNTDIINSTQIQIITEKIYTETNYKDMSDFLK